MVSRRERGAVVIVIYHITIGIHKRHPQPVDRLISARHDRINALAALQIVENAVVVYLQLRVKHFSLELLLTHILKHYERAHKHSAHGKQRHKHPGMKRGLNPASHSRSLNV